VSALWLLLRVIVVSGVLNSFFVLVASVATHHHTELVNQYRDEYFATINPLEKKALLHEIVSRILERGRFLKSSNNNASGGGGGWDEVDQDRAILKTAHAIQYQRRKSVDRVPETPVRSSQSGRRAAPTTTCPEGPFVSVPHTVTPTTRTTPNAVSSWGNDLLLEPHAVVYRQGAANTVSTTARELLWTTMTMTPSSPSKDWKQSPTVGYPQYTSSSSNISSSSNSISRPQTTTIALRDACFLPQQQQQQRRERWWWYHSNPRRTCPAAEPVGSRHHGGSSRTEVVASSNDVKQPLCFDPCVIRSLDKVLAFDDCVDDNARLYGNPFDEESIGGRNDNDDDVSSIGSLNGDPLELSLLGTLDMSW
jgi:hypothetical protein